MEETEQASMQVFDPFHYNCGVISWWWCHTLTQPRIKMKCSVTWWLIKKWNYQMQLKVSLYNIYSCTSHLVYCIWFDDASPHSEWNQNKKNCSWLFYMKHCTRYAVTYRRMWYKTLMPVLGELPFVRWKIVLIRKPHPPNNRVKWNPN